MKQDQAFKRLFIGLFLVLMVDLCLCHMEILRNIYMLTLIDL